MKRYIRSSITYNPSVEFEYYCKAVEGGKIRIGTIDDVIDMWNSMYDCDVTYGTNQCSSCIKVPNIQIENILSDKIGAYISIDPNLNVFNNL